MTPVGDTREISVNVRVVAATHQNLRDLIAAGRFRADLYFRLNVIEIKIPSLRERPADILPLAQHFLKVFNQRLDRNLQGFDAEAEQVLQQLPYPGNVRELENVVERAVALETGSRITTTYLPDPGATAWLGRSTGGTEAGLQKPADSLQIAVRSIERWLDQTDGVLDSEDLVDRFEKAILEAALRRTDGNKTEAAQRLGLTFRVLRYKLSKHGHDAGNA